jgi:hypothetical protein
LSNSERMCIRDPSHAGREIYLARGDAKQERNGIIKKGRLNEQAAQV